MMHFKCESEGLPIMLFSTFKILCTDMGRSLGPQDTRKSSHLIYALLYVIITNSLQFNLKMNYFKPYNIVFDYQFN